MEPNRGSPEGLLDEILDRAPCGFVSFSDDGRIAAINATLLERLGFSREQLAGRHVETILTTSTKIFYQTHFFPLVRLHGEAREIFLLLRANDASAVAVLCNANRRSREGTYYTDCVMLEVQERRKFEEALLEARRSAERSNAELEAVNERLEAQALELELQQQQLIEQARELEAQRQTADEANHAKSNFLAVMSHELRTPLNAIGGYVQLLEMEVHGPVSAAQREALARIDRSQRHLLRLINDVLNLSRIEAGRVDYNTGPVALTEVATSVIPMVEPQIEARGLRFELQIPSDLIAIADRDKVQQVLLNLLTNAVKFTAVGGLVRVDGGADETSSRVFIRVTDTGLGIPANMLESVFEPFVQVDTAPARAAEGSGLGLAISRDLARGMGGDITLQSDVGVGSVFTLHLRRA
jgi:PAS domain S-box-containing protein